MINNVLHNIKTEDLIDELKRRNAIPTFCRCHKWTAYFGEYDHDGYTLRCHGCLRAIAKCRCL